MLGVKHLFNESLKGQIDRFVSIDGTGYGITRIAVGSHRYRVAFKGPGGHSYGAFMTANLLAHTDLFKAGIARSGACNRTLTPFGFQSERRTYWANIFKTLNVPPAFIGQPLASAGRRVAAMAVDLALIGLLSSWSNAWFDAAGGLLGWQVWRRRRGARSMRRR